jgi:hypothetical protein
VTVNVTVKTGFDIAKLNDPQNRVLMGLSANQNAGFFSDRRNPVAVIVSRRMHAMPSTCLEILSVAKGAAKLIDDSVRNDGR